MSCQQAAAWGLNITGREGRRVAAKRVGDETTTHVRAWNTSAWCKSATASFVLGTFDRVVEAQHVRTEIHTPRTNYQPLQTLTFFLRSPLWHLSCILLVVVANTWDPRHHYAPNLDFRWWFLHFYELAQLVSMWSTGSMASDSIDRCFWDFTETWT